MNISIETDIIFCSVLESFRVKKSIEDIQFDWFLCLSFWDERKGKKNKMRLKIDIEYSLTRLFCNYKIRHALIFHTPTNTQTIITLADWALHNAMSIVKKRIFA